MLHPSIISKILKENRSKMIVKITKFPYTFIRKVGSSSYFVSNDLSWFTYLRNFPPTTVTHTRRANIFLSLRFAVGYLGTGHLGHIILYYLSARAVWAVVRKRLGSSTENDYGAACLLPSECLPATFYENSFVLWFLYRCAYIISYKP